MKRSICFTLMFVLLIGCAAQAKPKNKKPDWLTNPKKIYPEAMYMTAVGEGDTRSQAENYAAANLSKIFESKVSADEKYVQQYREIQSSKGDSFAEESEVIKAVNIQSAQTLYNIQFAESYTDPLGSVSVLAYLNRLQTAQIYDEKIENNSNSVKYYRDLSLVSGNVLTAYAAMNMAAVFSSENQRLMGQLEIIHPTSAEFIELEYDHNEIIRSASQLAHNIRFAIDIENDAENKIGILLEEMFTDLGFTMGGPSNLKVDGRISFEEADLNRNDFEFVRYELQLKVSDPEDVIVAAITEKGKEGHTTYKEAQARAIRKLGSKIDISLRKKVMGYFNSLVASKPKN